MSLLSLMFYNMWIVVITADLVVIDLDVCKKKQTRPTTWSVSFASFNLFLALSYLDSNQDKQNQNLLCYHYTIGQSLCASFRKSAAKLVFFICLCKLFVEILWKSVTNTLSEPYSAISKK